MVGVGDLPELGVWISRVDDLRMAHGNVAVDLAVNQENRDRRGCDGIFGRNILHAEVVLQAGAEEGDFDQWTEEEASDPGAKAEGLSHAVVGDLAKTCEGRFGDDGAEMWVRVERLQEFRRTHGFAEGEDAVGMIFPFLSLALILAWRILRFQKIDPLMDVVALQQAVGGERAVARAVGTGVGEKHGESVGEEQLRVSGHADAVVAEAVQE